MRCPKRARHCLRGVRKISNLGSQGTSQSSNLKPVRNHAGISFKTLKNYIKEGKVDTVCCAINDLYGRNMGKRFDGDYFVNSVAKSGTGGCTYLLAMDIEGTPLEGFSYASWKTGYGDLGMEPDMSAIRYLSWLDKTALVICDAVDEQTRLPIEVSPRNILKNAVEQAKRLGFGCNAASELEYYVFKESNDDCLRHGYRQGEIHPSSKFFQDYDLHTGTREEYIQSTIRRELKASGIKVECTKGEAYYGQHEINVLYSDILDMADCHTAVKSCVRDVVHSMEHTATFMAKPFTEFGGSSCHIHINLTLPDGSNAFVSPDTKDSVLLGASDVFNYFLGGLISHTPEFFCFFAPNPNSYKRFVRDSWAPTKLAWATDNRTAGFRVVGVGTKQLRVEIRLPAADVNPYLALAAALHLGLEGVEKNICCGPPILGNIYSNEELKSTPSSLYHAVKLFQESDVTARRLGSEVVEHYAHFFNTEQIAYDKEVMDWERRRYFERI